MSALRSSSRRRSKLSSEGYRILIENVTDYAIYTLDTEGHVASWNGGAEKITGYKTDEIIGEDFATFFTAEDIAAGLPQRELEIARETGRFEAQGWRMRKDGSRFWADVVITTLRDESGNLLGYGRVVRDLTERHHAEDERLRVAMENALREANLESLRAFIESLPAFAWMALPDGYIDFYNRRCLEYLGKTNEELRGWGWEQVQDPKLLPTVLARWKESLASGEPLEIEFPMMGADGVFRWFLTRAQPLRVNGEIIRWIGINIEIDALKRTQETLEAANRAKDEFLATVSHELRTPLSAILGWASMLRQRQLDPTLVKPIEVIHRNALAQVKLIDDILDVSRVITGKLKVEPKPTDLVAIARTAIETIRPSADAKRITVELRPELEPALLVVDPDRIQQAVWNLLSNAVKFTDAGGRIQVVVFHKGSNVALSVTDSGKGIDPEFLPFVFDRFRQADSSITRKFGGLGLGLALVRHIVELHGGQAAAASEGVGKGATFTITLPVRAVVPAAPETPAPRLSIPPPGVEASLSGARVLVVDDEPDARDMLAEVLVRAGAVVETSPSAAEGFERFKTFRPDVLVSDLSMPDEDGLSFMRRIRALPDGGRVPSLALTAFTRDEDRTRALSAGYTTHIGKPVDPKALVFAVANLSSVNGGR